MQISGFLKSQRFLANIIHARTRSLPSYCLRDGWVAKQQHGVLEKKVPWIQTRSIWGPRLQY